jgi:hypothetical protein
VRPGMNMAASFEEELEETQATLATTSLGTPCDAKDMIRGFAKLRLG